MTPSWRKPFGMFAIMALIAAWAVLAITLAERIPILDNPVYYIFAGLVWIWVLPLRRLLAWMELGRW